MSFNYSCHSIIHVIQLFMSFIYLCNPIICVIQLFMTFIYLCNPIICVIQLFMSFIYLCNPIICVIQLFMESDHDPLLTIRTIKNIVVVWLNKLWLNKRSANIVPVQWGGRLRCASLHCPGLSTRLSYSNLYYCHDYL
jgi:hypothetical protein